LQPLSSCCVPAESGSTARDRTSRYRNTGRNQVDSLFGSGDPIQSLRATRAAKFPFSLQVSYSRKGDIPHRGQRVLMIAPLAVLSLRTLKFLKIRQLVWLISASNVSCRMRLELHCASLSLGTESTRRATRGPAVSSTF
jgi:hypothetical protein